MLDPALVVRVGVGPSVLNFVSESPHEVSFNELVEGIKSAVAELQEVLVAEVEGIRWALAISDNR